MKTRSKHVTIGERKFIKFDIKAVQVDDTDSIQDPIYETYIIIDCLNMDKTEFINSLPFKEFYNSLNNSNRRYYDYSKVKNKLVRVIITCPSVSKDFKREYFGFLDYYGVLILIPNEVFGELMSIDSIDLKYEPEQLINLNQ